MSSWPGWDCAAEVGHGEPHDLHRGARRSGQAVGQPVIWEGLVLDWSSGGDSGLCHQQVGLVKVIQHLLRWQLLLRWCLQQQKVRVRVMIWFLVRSRVRIKIRIRVRVRVGVTFYVSVYRWSNCRRSKCCPFLVKSYTNPFSTARLIFLATWVSILTFQCFIYSML